MVLSFRKERSITSYYWKIFPEQVFEGTGMPEFPRA
jgi:hypothetical protein